MCTHCSRFMKQTKCNRAAHLHHLLLLSALHPRATQSTPSTPASVLTLTVKIMALSSASKSSSQAAHRVEHPSQQFIAEQSKKQPKLKPKKAKVHKAEKAEKPKCTPPHQQIEKGRGEHTSIRVSESDIVNPETLPPVQILEVPVRQRSPPVLPVAHIERRDLYSRLVHTGAFRDMPGDTAQCRQFSRPLTVSSASDESPPAHSVHRHRSHSQSRSTLSQQRFISRSSSYASRLSRMDRDYDREYRIQGDRRRILFGTDVTRLSLHIFSSLNPLEIGRGKGTVGNPDRLFKRSLAHCTVDAGACPGTTPLTQTAIGSGVLEKKFPLLIDTEN